MLADMARRTWLLLAVTALLVGCATSVTFPTATPDKPTLIKSWLVRPDGNGPFPAVVLMHGCHGVMKQTFTWAEWLARRGYAALIVDSYGPRGEPADCQEGPPDDQGPQNRFADAMGALRYLQTQPFVRGDRVAIMGWSQGGVIALAAINGPSLERARRRGVDMPESGYAAAIGLYPGGCQSLVPELVVRPLLLLLAADDDWTPLRHCQAMVEAMRARGADITMVVYPGAYHYFDVAGQRREVLMSVRNSEKPGGYGVTVAYQRAAAEDAYRQVDGFLLRHLKGTAAR
jgi:dienelactone hydrolase